LKGKFSWRKRKGCFGRYEKVERIQEKSTTESEGTEKNMIGKF